MRSSASDSYDGVRLTALHKAYEVKSPDARKVIAALPLPVAGLVSDKPLNEVIGLLRTILKIDAIKALFFFLLLYLFLLLLLLLLLLLVSPKGCTEA